LKDKGPGKVLRMFFEAWMKRDWKAMAKCAQKSWLEVSIDPEEYLKGMFNFKLRAFEVIEEVELNNVAFAAKVLYRYDIARNVSKNMSSDVRVICEVEPMVPAPDGEWGVNPNSVVVT